MSLLSRGFEDAGLEVRRLPGKMSGGQLLARGGRESRDGRRGRPLQLLLGHCDTVWPIGTLREMPVEVTDDVIRGPGVYDMKGGLAQMVFALRALRELNITPEVSPVVFVNSDEEKGSRESSRYIEKLACRASRALVLEPAFGPDGRLKTARKGGGRFEIEVIGKSAHAGLDPEAGASAILELSHVIQKLDALNDPERGVTVNVGVIEGGYRPNVVAAKARALVDVRVPSGTDAARVEYAIGTIRPVTPGSRSAAGSAGPRWSAHRPTGLFGTPHGLLEASWDWSFERLPWGGCRTATRRAFMRRRSMAWDRRVTGPTPRTSSPRSKASWSERPCSRPSCCCPQISSWQEKWLAPILARLRSE